MTSQNKKQMLGDLSLLILLSLARAVLARTIQSDICFILLYTAYILYTYVLQLIINSTMYTIVPVCVSFSNFGNINAVYMHFYLIQSIRFNKGSEIFVSINITNM